jgi:hypothetical protein
LAAKHSGNGILFGRECAQPGGAFPYLTGALFMDYLNFAGILEA